MLRAFLWALVGSLCVSALLAIAALLSGDFSTTEERILLSTLAFGAASGLSLAASVGWGRARPLAAGTVVSAAVLLVLAAHWLAVGAGAAIAVELCVLILTEADVGGGDERLLGVLGVLAVLGTLLTVLFRRLEPRAAAGPLVGRRIAAVEEDQERTVLVLDDGRRLRLAGDEQP